MYRTDDSHPTAFISYSWDSETHRAWVRALAARLRSDGVDVVLDQWHVVPGDQLPEFMERSIRENDFVIIVCTLAYKVKSEARSGGVGYEGNIITGEVFVRGDHRKFIPVLRVGDWPDASPSWLMGKYYIDLRGEPYLETNYLTLLAAVYRNRPILPDVGPAKFPVDLASGGAESVRPRLNLLRHLTAPDQIGLGKKSINPEEADLP